MILRSLIFCLVMALGCVFSANASAQLGGPFWGFQLAKDDITVNTNKFDELEMAAQYVLKNWELIFPNCFVAGTDNDDLITLSRDGDEIKICVSDSLTGEVHLADSINVADYDISRIVIFATKGSDVVLSDSSIGITVVGATDPDGEPDRETEVLSQGDVEFIKF